jgi:hypothetical protein
VTKLSLSSPSLVPHFNGPRKAAYLCVAAWHAEFAAHRRCPIMAFWVAARAAAAATNGLKATPTASKSRKRSAAAPHMKGVAGKASK